MYTKAIVRTPGRTMTVGLSKANLGTPDYAKALEQHRRYIVALQSCGLEVLILDADDAYPDSTFIEDVALLTPHCAIITRPAAPSRRGETTGVRPILERFYSSLEEIKAPATLEGGDVLQVGQHFYIGLSSRTNVTGADQLIAILESYGMTATKVPVSEFLHLKTGVTCVSEQALLAAGELVSRAEFSCFKVLPVAEGEIGAANCLSINGRVIIPAGFPQVRQQLLAEGVQLIEVDISEFAKLDGGLTCLSLRF